MTQEFFLQKKWTCEWGGGWESEVWRREGWEKSCSFLGGEVSKYNTTLIYQSLDYI